jgi:hypothetical protein
LQNALDGLINAMVAGDGRVSHYPKGTSSCIDPAAASGKACRYANPFAKCTLQAISFTTYFDGFFALRRFGGCDELGIEFADRHIACIRPDLPQPFRFREVEMIDRGRENL